MNDAKTVPVQVRHSSNGLAKRLWLLFALLLTSIVAYVAMPPAEAHAVPATISGDAYIHCTNPGQTDNDGNIFAAEIKYGGRSYYATGHCIDEFLPYPADGWYSYVGTWNGSAYDVIIDSSPATPHPQCVYTHGPCQRVGNLSFTPVGYAKLKKTSNDAGSITGNPNYSIDNAEYGVYSDAGCGTRVGTLTTNANGDTNTIELVEGTYYVRETRAPEGHDFDTQTHSVYVSSGATTTVSASDPTQRTKISIQKTSTDARSLTNKRYSLEGIQYTVTHAGPGALNNQVAGTITLDANGYGELSGLLYDTYTITETYVPTACHYDKDTTKYTVDANIGAAQQTRDVRLNLKDTPKKGSIQVVKSADKTEIANSKYYNFDGIQYTLINTRTKEKQTVSLDQNGNGTFDNLLYDVYTIQETKTNNCYQLNTDIQTLDLSTPIQLKANFTDNGETGRIDIVKTSKDQDSLKNPYYTFEGIEYTITNVETKAKSVARLNSNGTASVDNLILGDYKIQETKTNKWYEIDNTVYSVSIVASQKNAQQVKINPIVTKFTCSDKPVYVDIDLTKTSADTRSHIDGSDYYNFASTEYTLENTRDSSIAGHGSKLVTDASGYAKSQKVLIDDWQVHETRSPQGYAINPTCYNVAHDQLTPNQTYTIKSTTGENKVKDEPQDDTPGHEVHKVNAETNTNVPAGAGTLDGAVYALKYYAEADKNDVTPTTEPLKTWYLKTDKDGRLNFENIKAGDLTVTRIETQLATSEFDGGRPVSKTYTFTSDEPYIRNDKIVLPLGVISIQEVLPPSGYNYDNGNPSTSKNGGTFNTYQLTSDNTTTQTTLNQKITLTSEELVYRSNLNIKKQTDKGAPLPGVPFLITSKTTGEWHVAVTDQNGEIKTNQLDNAADTNPNDGLLKIDNDGNPTITDEAKLNATKQIWFTGYANDDENATKVNQTAARRGAFVYDTYTIQEIRCNANYGYALANGEITVAVNTKNHTEIPNGLIIDKTIEIHTTATDALTSSHVSALPDNGTTSINDEIAYTNLDVTKHYRMTGTLVDKDTQKPVTRADGSIITASTDFTPTTTDGTVTVTFSELDRELLDGRTVVAFERLFENGIECAKHEDINDEWQTVYYPVISTTATDKATGDHEGLLDGDSATIVDEVVYKSLLPGKSYTMTGTLMDKETGEPLLDENGSEFVVSRDFSADSSSGSVSLEFVVPSSVLQGKSVVVFENCLIENRSVCVHADIDDEGQTVMFPGVHTTATDQFNGKHEANTAQRTVTVDDAVAYENLVAGKSYKLTGTLMNKATGEPLLDENGKKFVSSVEFVAGEKQAKPSRENVVTDFDKLDYSKVPSRISFLTNDYKNGKEWVTIDTSDWVIDYADTYVRMLPKADADADIPDEALVWKYDGSASYYESENRLTGQDGNPIFSGARMHDIDAGNIKLFYDDSADDSSSNDGFYDDAVTVDADGRAFGTIHVLFDVQSELVKGTSTVVFEQLFDNFGADTAGCLIDRHEDISDDGQTVVFPVIHTMATDGVTGTHAGNAGNDGDTESTVVINDEVSYDNLTAGTSYTVSGTLMNKATGEPITYKNGETVTASTTFTPEGETGKLVSGSITVTFEVERSIVEGLSTVVFENLYNGDVILANKLIADHRDLDDENQEVKYPSVRTTATVNEKHEAATAEDTVLVDKVSYDNLVPGQRYRVDGVLMDKATGTAVADSNGDKIVGSAEFIAEDVSGYVNVEFRFDSSDLDEHETVVFEKLYQVDGGLFSGSDDILVGQHEDIDDMGQTVRFDAEEPILETGDAGSLGLPVVAALLLASSIASTVVVMRRRAARMS